MNICENKYADADNMLDKILTEKVKKKVERTIKSKLEKNCKCKSSKKCDCCKK